MNINKDGKLSKEEVHEYVSKHGPKNIYNINYNWQAANTSKDRFIS